MSGRRRRFSFELKAFGKKADMLLHFRATFLHDAEIGRKPSMDRHRIILQQYPYGGLGPELPEPLSKSLINLLFVQFLPDFVSQGGIPA